MGFMSILRTHTRCALNILCASAHQDFSLNSILSTILVFPFFSSLAFTLSPPSLTVYTCACWFFPSSSSWKIHRFSGNLCSIPTSACFVCAHTRIFFYFLFRLSRVFLTFLSRLLYLHFPIFFPISLASTLHAMQIMRWRLRYVTNNSHLHCCKSRISCFNFSGGKKLFWYRFWLSDSGFDIYRSTEEWNLVTCGKNPRDFRGIFPNL